MRLHAAHPLDSDLQEAFGEYESPQQSYFTMNAYQIMPDGSYRLLQTVKPWLTNEDEAAKVLTGICRNWANKNPGWRIAVRCYRRLPVSRQWQKCGFWSTCTDIS
jgi:hypothetical protein